MNSPIDLGRMIGACDAPQLAQTRGFLGLRTILASWLLVFAWLLFGSMAAPAAAQTPPGNDPGSQKIFNMEMGPNRSIFRPSLDPERTANGLAQTPPMGWNSWNKFGCDIDEEKVRAVADVMVSSGMRDAGYQYVVIDDCWQSGRDARGDIQADPAKFPSGMAALSDYIHARGLKFGIYSDAGTKTCGGRPGSQGHEYQDAATYAAWGVDYLKYDWCFTGTRNSEEAYATMADALRATERPIVLSICNWGISRPTMIDKSMPWEWGQKIGNLWRTTEDIYDSWAGRKGTSLGTVNIVDLTEPLYGYAGPGHWNDPDMLEIGNGGQSDDEYRSQFSLWAMMAAPLIAGNDIAKMDAKTRAILTNKEVIAVDQDSQYGAGRRVRDDGDLEVWSKPLSDGGRAVVLFNRGEKAAAITARWSEIGYPPATLLAVRDLWRHQSLGRKTDSLTVDVAPHAVVMVRLAQ
ncbi:MAG: glycoside hydrolase family 27 protein [Sphingomonas sp.]